jgi:hypothetical protein
MNARRYFAPSYWASRYWARGSAPPEIPTPTASPSINRIFRLWLNRPQQNTGGDVPRYRLGDTIQISLTAAGADSVPVSVIRDDEDNEIATISMSYLGGTLFGLAISASWPDFSVGTFTVTTSWVASGQSASVQNEFDIVPGGDPAGRVISMVPSRDGDKILIQTESGKILQGTPN